MVEPNKVKPDREKLNQISATLSERNSLKCY